MWSRWRTTAHGRPAPDEDPRFTDAWARLARATVAAHRHDYKTWRRVVDHLWAEDDNWVPRVLAGVMLNLELLEEVGKEPSSQQISELARRIQEPYARFVGEDTGSLINLFHTLFDRALPEQSAAGKQLIWQGTAALGFLLEKPARDLRLMRPSAESYFRSVVDWADEQWAKGLPHGGDEE